MKKLIRNTIYLFLLLSVSACLKVENSALKQQENDDQLIVNFLQRNNINATKSPTGIYYVLDNAGTGTQPSSNTQIASIDVNLFLLGGARFVSEKDVVYRFQNGLLIPALVEATSLLKEGGRGRFYIPSALALGQNSGTVNGVNVPANSVVYAELTLNDVRTDQEQQAFEDTAIKKYISDRKLTSTKDSLGVYYVRQTAGAGAPPRTGNRVTLNYAGTLLSGQSFDSGTGFTFSLGAGTVIRGFDIAARFMRRNEKGIAMIPSHLAYGDRGSGDRIRPFATLVFELEVTGLE
jgi:FKBP-type peptidyl-prolyl cis-trans isomerase FkpA